MPEGSPFGPGIKAAVAYLHGCQMVSFKRLTELDVIYDKLRTAHNERHF